MTALVTSSETMRFSEAIDLYIDDMRRYGRLNSDRSEDAYRRTLYVHGEDIGNKDPRVIGRNQIKTTLARWSHPNSQRRGHAVLISFYDWAMEEGLRKDNPARQVRKAKKRETSVYRLTRDEVVRLMDACRNERERRVIYLGLCAGLRNQEMRGLRGEHFQREGFVWVSADIGKGQKERWVPVIPDAQEVIDSVRASVKVTEYVIGAPRTGNPSFGTVSTDPTRPSSPQSIWRLVSGVAIRAGISAHIHPHLLRHAYGDHVAKYAGLRAAQALLGHASVDTTASTYVDRPGLDELTISVHGFSFRPSPGIPLTDPLEFGSIPPTGFEPVDESSSLLEPNVDDPQEG